MLSSTGRILGGEKMIAIAEIGHFALIMAFVASLCQAGWPLLGSRYQSTLLMAQLQLAAMCLVFMSFAALLHGFVTSDFSIALVARDCTLASTSESATYSSVSSEEATACG